MMRQTLMKAIMNSISEVMETMFFLPVDFGSETRLDDIGIQTNDAIACELIFKGDASGRLIIVCPQILAREMAGNFMGESFEKLLPVHLLGTLTELLNMVCGNALSHVKSRTPYELGIPRESALSGLEESTLWTPVETIESKMAVSLVLDKA